jgi:hypothetical protein
MIQSRPRRTGPKMSSALGIPGRLPTFHTCQGKGSFAPGCAPATRDVDRPRGPCCRIGMQKVASVSTTEGGSRFESRTTPVCSRIHDDIRTLVASCRSITPRAARSPRCAARIPLRHTRFLVCSSARMG